MSDGFRALFFAYWNLAIVTPYNVFRTKLDIHKILIAIINGYFGNQSQNLSLYAKITQVIRIKQNNVSILPEPYKMNWKEASKTKWRRIDCVWSN